MLEALGEKFGKMVSKIRGYGKLTEDNISEALKMVRLALLEADVHVKVVRSFLDRVKERALGQDVLESLKAHELFLKIVHEELIEVLGGQAKEIQFRGKSPHLIMMVGLQGSGKTSSSAKIAKYYKSKGRQPYLVPADVYRPAAIQQLQILAKSIEVPCYDTPLDANPVKIAKKAIKEAQKNFCDLVIIDTAGRLQIDDKLMDELRKMKKKLDDVHILFVADAMTGQEAVKVAQGFHENLTIDGVVLSKMDGDAKGGAVLSISHVAQCPVHFIGQGEKVDDLDLFHPERIASRLLDRGDLMSLVEKANEVIDEDEALKVAQKIKKDSFDLEDFRGQLKQMKKIGSMKNMLSFLPGSQKMLGKVDMKGAEKELLKKEAILNSMTPKERQYPKILNGSRRLRIANGSGTQVSDINRLLKEFAQMKKMLKQVSKSGLGGLGALKSLMR